MPPHFVGREGLVDALAARLISSKEGAVALEGMPGVGKSTLAVALVHHRQVLAHFDDGVLWTSLGPQGEASTALANWGLALGEDLSQLAELEDRRQAVKRLIGQKSLLLVIDDVWNIKSAQDLQCGGPNCCHLLTSREAGIARDFAGRRQTSNVPTLEKDAAYILLEELAPEACAAEPEASRQLARAVGGLPLALELLGGYLAAPERSLFSDLSAEAMMEMADPARRLALASVRLGARRAGVVTLKATILLSLDSLPEQVQNAFYALGAFAPKPEHFTRKAGKTVAAASTRSLALLAARNLLEVRGDELALHQVVADVARGGTAPEAIGRHRDYYLSLVNRDLEDWQTIASAYGQISWAWNGLPEDENLVEWVQALWLFQVRRGLRADLLTWAQRGLQVTETKGMHREQASLLNDLGSIYHDMEQWERALDYYQRSLTFADELGDRVGFATVLNNMGLMHKNLGQSEGALECYEQALPIFEEIGDRDGLATTLLNLGSLHADMGQRQRALEYWQQALPIFEEIGDRDGLASTLHEFASLYADMGRRQQALEYLQQALAIREEIGDLAGLAATLLNLGSLYHKLGQGERALEYYQQAMPIYEEMDDRAGLATTLNNLGMVYDYLGQRQRALEYCTQALSIVEEIDDRAGLAGTLHNIAFVCDNLGQRQRALQYYQQALPIREEVGDRDGLAATLHNLGRLYDKLEQGQRALEYYQQALSIREELDDRAGLATTLHNLGTVYDKLEQRQRALEYYQQALPIFEEVGDRDQESITRYNLGMLYRSLDRLEEAVDELRRVVDLDRQMGHPDLESDLDVLREAEEALKKKGGDG